MSCECAKVTDEYHGWECSITDGACEFLIPNSKKCAELFGEGPNVEKEEDICFASASGQCIHCLEYGGLECNGTAKEKDECLVFNEVG